MDILINFLKPLITSLSPTSFLGLISLLALTVLLTLKIMSKIPKSSDSSGMFSFMTGQADAEIGEEENMISLQKKLDMLILTIDTLTTNQKFEYQTEKIIQGLNGLKTETQNTLETLDDHDSRVSGIQKQVDEIVKQINNEFNEIKMQLKMQTQQQHQDIEAAKELQQRMHGIISRTISQVEKVDEFIRTTVPEFRSYNKDVIKDLADLSTEVALIERNIQNYITVRNTHLR